jgi:hypothetical protein
MHHDETLIQNRLRGFSSGCQPDDFVSCDMQIGKFGSVAYERKLTEEEIQPYELELVRVEGDE